MNILILGSGALSHYFAEKFAEDPLVEKVYHPNFDKSIKNSHKYFPISFKNQFLTTSKSLEEFVSSEKIDLIVPVEHRYQLFKNLRSIIETKKIPVLMPSEKIAMLEWSKIEGKKLLQSLGIPTAPYKVFTTSKLIENFFNISRPFVLKYDQDWRAGLQTVIVTDENVNEQFEYFKKEGLINYYGINRYTKEQYFIVEDFIKGKKEYSYHVLSNSSGWIYLGTARDYKKRFESDNGYNTASCGSYSLVEDVDPRITNYVNKIFKNLETPYIGVLYLGILIDENDNPIVLEINTRFGDPEFTSISQLIENKSLVNLFLECANNKKMNPIIFSNKKSVSLRIINKEYSLTHLNSKEINSPNLDCVPSDLSVNYNLTRGLLYCVITSTADTIKEASDKIYNYLKDKDMGNYTYRKDIGYFL